ncbi:hypothetical protein MRX96_058438 [Rhipicephalus microplus]
MDRRAGATPAGVSQLFWTRCDFSVRNDAVVTFLARASPRAYVRLRSEALRECDRDICMRRRNTGAQKAGALSPVRFINSDLTAHHCTHGNYAASFSYMIRK